LIDAETKGSPMMQQWQKYFTNAITQNVHWQHKILASRT